MKTTIKNLINNDRFWEFIGYFTLGLCIFGQITVGYWYLVAQSAYLMANLLGVIRDIKLNLPKANTVRDVTFTAITIALIAIRFF